MLKVLSQRALPTTHRDSIIRRDIFKRELGHYLTFEPSENATKCIVVKHLLVRYWLNTYRETRGSVLPSEQCSDVRLKWDFFFQR